MIRKSRLIAALGAALALSVSGIAFAGGADAITTIVDGGVNPSKLDKKKYKPINLFLGVRNEATVTGTQSNPASEYISIGKNVKVDLKKAELCTAPLPNGITTEAARDACPADSFLGEGVAETTAPGGTVIGPLTVSVFNGPQQGQLRLHTYSPQTAAASPVVPAAVVKSKDGSKYGQALDVPAAPETGALLITKFNATIDKSTKVATARCKSKSIPFLRSTRFKDGSTSTAELVQKCKQKKKKK